MHYIVDQTRLNSISKLNLCIFHAITFILEFILIMFLVTKHIYAAQTNSIVSKIVERYAWNLLVIRHIHFFINLKSIIAENIHAYAISMYLTVNRSIIAILGWKSIKSVAEEAISPAISIVFFVLSAIELAIGILYLHANKTQLRFVNFKKTGPCLKNMEAYRCIEIIRYISLLDVAHSSAHIFDTIFLKCCKVAIMSLIEFIISGMISISTRVDLKLNTSGFSNYTLIIMVVGFLKFVVDVVFILKKMDIFDMWYPMALTVYGLFEKLLMRIVMLYWMAVYWRLSIAPADLDNMLIKNVYL